MERENRINIAPLARQIKEGLFTEVRHYGGFSVLGVEQLHLYSKLKPELYALSAVFIDEVVKKALDSRNELQPFGLVTLNDAKDGYRVAKFQDLDEIYPFVSVTRYMWDTFGTLVDQEIREIESGRSSPPIESVYKRLKELVSLVHSNIDSPVVWRRYKNVETFIKSGFNFAAVVMGGLTEVIIRVDGNLDNPQGLLQIAKNSYPLVAELAMSNTEKADIAHILQGWPFEVSLPFPFVSKYFAIEGVGDEARLVISKVGEERLVTRGISLEDLASGRSPTLGCPAMVNFGDGSAVKKLWDWHVEIAEKIYPHLVAGP